jgi:hypothetical protein
MEELGFLSDDENLTLLLEILHKLRKLGDAEHLKVQIIAIKYFSYV